MMTQNTDKTIARMSTVINFLFLSNSGFNNGFEIVLKVISTDHHDAVKKRIRETTKEGC